MEICRRGVGLLAALPGSEKFIQDQRGIQ